MAIRFGNTSLQQRVIKKVQDQLNRKASTKREASPEDITTFRAQMGDRDRYTVKDNRDQGMNSLSIESNRDSSIEARQASVMQDNRNLQKSSEIDAGEDSGSSSYKSPGDQILETLAEMSKSVKQIDGTASTETTTGY